MKMLAVRATATTPTSLLLLFGVVVSLLVVFFLGLSSSTFFKSNCTTTTESSEHPIVLQHLPHGKSSGTRSKTNDRYNALCTSSTNHNDGIGWEFAGPTTYISQFGSKNVPKLASAAAVQNVVEAANHTWFISSVNGGVWKSTNLQKEATTANALRHHSNNVNVHWENVLDGQVGVTCTSMAALHVSSSNPSTIYAGCGGSTSGEQGYDWNVVNSGDWNGIIMSTNLGTTWSMMPGFPENFYVTDILEMDSETLLVAAQSHMWDKYNGGIWRSENGGRSFERVCTTPTFTLTLLDVSNSPSSWWKKFTAAATSDDFQDSSGDAQQQQQHAILATHAHSSTHTASISIDRGVTFVDIVLPWSNGAVPFYTCATQLANSGTIVIAGLTRLPGSNNHHGHNTCSQIFVLGEDPNNYDDDTGTTTEWIELKQPMCLDKDGMPKDRMALLADPVHGDLLYVAGNGGALVWQVNITTGSWTKLWHGVDRSIPHVDCRNFAWDDQNNHLLLVSDGGIFARTQPREAGGRWISLNGDYSALELLSAHYDPYDDRYVAGAQDNSAIVTKSNATPSDVGFGFVHGDGTVTMVDSQAKPKSRLFGTTQFLGVGTIENDPNTRTSPAKAAAFDDDDDGCGGLCFAQGDKFIQVEVNKYFPEPSSFPFFVHPYTLNVQDPTLLHFWTNASSASHRPSAFYEFSIPYTVTDKDDIGAPTKLLETPPGAMIMDFVSGGYTNGQADPNLLIGISNTHLYVRSLVDKTGPPGNHGGMVERPLPMKFAAPVTLEYDDSHHGARILGPLTHAKTVSMAVSLSDSHFVAVTGWPSVKDNLGDEAIFVTMNAGQTWQNVTGNLREACGVAGKVRPGGLLLIDLPAKESSSSSSSSTTTRALLVGTSNGIMATFISSSSNDATTSIRNQEGKRQQQRWSRLGTCKDFPIVLVAGIDHEPISDRLVAATYGRGIYVLKNAKQKLLEAFAVSQLEKIGIGSSSMSSI